MELSQLLKYTTGMARTLCIIDYSYTPATTAQPGIYWPEAIQAVYVGARIVRERFGWKAGMKELPVVGILAASGRRF
jgi:hypothetical protein